MRQKALAVLGLGGVGILIWGSIFLFRDPSVLPQVPPAGSSAAPDVDESRARTGVDTQRLVVVNSTMTTNLSIEPALKSVPLGKVRERPLSRSMLGKPRRIKTTGPFLVIATNVPPGPESQLVTESEPVLEKLNALLDEDDVAATLKEARKLKNHANREVRLNVLQALAWIGPPALVDMVRFLDDRDEEIHDVAIDSFFSAVALLDLPDQAAVVLSLAAQTSDPAVRMKVQDELVLLPSRLSFKPLAVMLDDDDAAVREQARDKLEFISDIEFQSQREAMAWYGRNESEFPEPESSEGLR